MNEPSCSSDYSFQTNDMVHIIIGLYNQRGDILTRGFSYIILFTNEKLKPIKQSAEIKIIFHNKKRTERRERNYQHKNTDFYFGISREVVYEIFFFRNFASTQYNTLSTLQFKRFILYWKT